MYEPATNWRFMLIMSKFFQSGWRPSYGWAGLAIVVYHLIVIPTVVIVGSIYGISIPGVTDVPALTALLTSVIAIAGMRSYDKLNKTDTKD